MDRIDRIQIFGERCSGTNYIEHLLRQNLRFLKFSWPWGWKHSFCPPGAGQDENCLFVIIHRDPLTWIRSLHRNPWHTAPPLRGLEFPEFIRHEWWCIWDEHAGRLPDDPLYGTEMMEERSPLTGERFPNVLRMRSAKIGNWTALSRKAGHCCTVCYEDVSEDPEGFVAQVSDRFGISRRRIFRDVTGEKGTGVPWRKKDYAPIDDEDLEFILRELDAGLEKGIGYDLASSVLSGR